MRAIDEITIARRIWRAKELSTVAPTPIRGHAGRFSCRRIGMSVPFSLTFSRSARLWSAPYCFISVTPTLFVLPRSACFRPIHAAVCRATMSEQELRTAATQAGFTAFQGSTSEHAVHVTVSAVYPESSCKCWARRVIVDIIYFDNSDAQLTAWKVPQVIQHFLEVWACLYANEPPRTLSTSQALYILVSPLSQSA